MTRRNTTRDFRRVSGVLIGVTIVAEENIAIYDAQSEPIRDRLATGVVSATELAAALRNTISSVGL